MRISFMLMLLCFTASVASQSIAPRLSAAYEKLMRDDQFKYAIVGMTVIDQQTGKVLFDRNGNVGLAAASTQKILTAVTAFDLLGVQFNYTTKFLTRKINATTTALYVLGSGDPTLGSWRFESTKPARLFSALDVAMPTSSSLMVGYLDDQHYDPVAVPGTWMIDDIGNYYGAGSWNINWRENQYDLHLSSDKIVGGPVSIRSEPGLPKYQNHLKVGKPGSGDNAYIYLPTADSVYILKGTIPPNERDFVISGAVPDGRMFMIAELVRHWVGRGNSVTAVGKVEADLLKGAKVIYEHQSPKLDSIIFYFLRKSINLYGEALLKTIGYRNADSAHTEVGTRAMKAHLISVNVPPGAVAVLDGSGLSPQNRITSTALATVLQYALKRAWFNSFYNALPVYNGMKMKSGSIGGVRSFAGYHKASNGKMYSFSIIVNNYNGSSGSVVQKLYKVLDELK
ncbi:MAG: D-alanyl-D-alanine carboxypeptidase/D-alanyl-D-alanine-endopeptidase [Chitinophagaceae bacterium]|nr:D-alanyl-D-alanine carboxypeptidase/D-alanyl-D-alanine-endopeptidase [Chitinophagaceae bacterium]